jgi:hypothetical protein
MMEQSILISTKKVLQIPDGYDVYDLDILTHINSALSVINQLGIGPEEGFVVEDDSAEWEDFVDDDPVILSLVKTHVQLKASLLFDPPSAGYLIDLKKDQIAELEWRLTVLHDARVAEEVA